MPNLTSIDVLISHPDDRGESPVLNLSKPNYTSEQSGSEGGRFADDDIMSDDEAPTSGDDKFIKTQDESKDKVNNNKSVDSKESNNNSDSVSQNGTNTNAAAALTSGLLAGFPNLLGAGAGTGEGKDNQLNNVYGLIGNIQALLKAAVENNAKEDKAKGKNY